MFAPNKPTKNKIMKRIFSHILLILIVTKFSLAQTPTRKKSLELDTLYLKEVIVSASRTAEPLMETPVTVERVTGSATTTPASFGVYFVAVAAQRRGRESVELADNEF
jgi:hypothetical protein